jgi:hypothetical protein
MKRITIGLTDEQGERFAAYLAEHEISDQEAGRVAIERLLASKPKKPEREAAKLKRGNPNFGKPSKDN